VKSSLRFLVAGHTLLRGFAARRATNLDHHASDVSFEHLTVEVDEQPDL
jgi:hypothetical protein